MLKNRTKKTAISSKQKIRRSVELTHGATPDQVVATLVALFEDLGLNVSHLISGVAKKGNRKPTAYTLYPFASQIGDMLTFWHQSPEYLDESGYPITLKLGGQRPSFRSLAKLKASTIDVCYLLSELERLGAVSIDANQFITVKMRSFPVYEDKRLAAHHTLNALDGFIKTLRHNLESSPSNSDQMFHRITWNDNFKTLEIPALKVRVKKLGQNFLESFDDWLARKAFSKSCEHTRGLKRAKVSIGIYLSVEPRN